MRLKITCSGFDLFIKVAIFIFHPVLYENLGLKFFDLCNSCKGINQDDFFQKYIKFYKTYFIVSYLFLVYLHMDRKRYKSDFNKISQFRKCPKRRKVLHKAPQLFLQFFLSCTLYIFQIWVFTIKRFLLHTLRNIYVFIFTPYVKHERNIYAWISSNTNFPE